MSDTPKQYDSIIVNCRDIFLKKQQDYGTSWRVLRTSSITDLLFIKARRIKVIEEGAVKKIDEGIDSEYIGIINYAMMGLIQLKLSTISSLDLPTAEIMKYYDEQIALTKSLMMAKNHDYGEAWRDMRLKSFTDMILMRIQRIRQIEDNAGKTNISEGIDANYMDLANYAVFALIMLDENN